MELGDALEKGPGHVFGRGRRVAECVEDVRSGLGSAGRGQRADRGVAIALADALLPEQAPRRRVPRLVASLVFVYLMR